MLTNVYLTQEAFDLLPEYSATYPSATTIGKQWKARDVKGWVMCEYVDHTGGDPTKVTILTKRIQISVAGLKRDQVCDPDKWTEMFMAEKNAGKMPRHNGPNGSVY